MALATVNVSGTRFEFDVNILDTKPHRMLSSLCKEAQKAEQPLRVTVGRSPECFSAILNYYQTGELHMPTVICPGVFKTELEFWGINSNELANCCFIKFHSFFVEQDTFQKFRRECADTTSSPYKPEVPVTPRSRGHVRTRLWNIVDNKENSWAAKIYFAVLFLMVMLSIVTLALSADPFFKRRLTKCEIIEYLQYSGHDHAHMVDNAFGNPDCSGGLFWHVNGDPEIDHDAEYYYDYEDNVGNISWTSNNTHWWWWWDNDTSTVYVDEYVDEEQVRADMAALVNNTSMQLDIPRKTVHLHIFDVIEKVVLVYFSVDFLLRIASCQSIFRYFMSVVNVIDLCALVASYVYVLVSSLNKEQRYLDNWVDLLNYLQIFRALRLFRVVQNVRASRVLSFSIRRNVRDLSVLGMFLVIGVSTLSSLMFVAESRRAFPSITAGWYWSVITMTTVGYGDYVPLSTVGRIVAVLCALSGVMLLSLTVPIFVNNFLSLYQFSTVDEIVQRQQMVRRRSKGPIHAVVPMETAKHANGQIIEANPPIVQVDPTICAEEKPPLRQVDPLICAA